MLSIFKNCIHHSYVQKYFHEQTLLVGEASNSHLPPRSAFISLGGFHSGILHSLPTYECYAIARKREIVGVFHYIKLRWD